MFGYVPLRLRSVAYALRGGFLVRPSFIDLSGPHRVSSGGSLRERSRPS